MHTVNGLSGSQMRLPGQKDTTFRKISLWQVGGEKPVFELTAENPLLPPGAFSHDGKTLAVTNRNTVTLYDVETGKPRKVTGLPNSNAITSVAFSPDNRTLGVGETSGRIMFFDVATGRPSGQLVGHEQAIRLLAFRGHDRLTSICWEGKLKDWNLRPEPPTGSTLPGQRVAADPMGHYVLCAEPTQADPRRFDNTFREVVLWDVASGKPKDVFRKPLAIPGTSFPASRPSAVFSPDGRRVGLVYSEMTPWRGLQWHHPRHVGLLLPTPLDWSAGLARASLGWVQQQPILSRTVVWDVPSGEVVFDSPEESGGPFGRDGRYLLLYPHRDDRIPFDPRRWREREPSLWDLAARPPRRIELEDPAIPVGPDERRIMNYLSGPGDRYLTGCATIERSMPRQSPVISGVFLLRWDLETGRLVFNRPLREEAKQYDRFTLSPDADRLLAAQIDDGRLLSTSPELRMWEIRPDGKAVLRIHHKGKEAEWLTGRDEGLTNLIPDVETGFTPDGKWLMVFAPTQARLWHRDAPPDKPIILRGFRGFPIVAAISEDGRRLVAVSDASPGSGPFGLVVEMKVWDLTSGQELLTFPFGASFGGFDLYNKFQTFDGKRLKLVLNHEIGNYAILDGSPREPGR